MAQQADCLSKALSDHSDGFSEIAVVAYHHGNIKKAIECIHQEMRS